MVCLKLFPYLFKQIILQLHVHLFLKLMLMSRLCSSYQQEPGRLGAAHAVSLGPPAEECGAWGSVPTYSRYDREWQEGPGWRDWGHRQHRKEKILGVAEESRPWSRGFVSRWSAAVDKPSLSADGSLFTVGHKHFVWLSGLLFPLHKSLYLQRLWQPPCGFTTRLWRRKVLKQLRLQ